MEANPLLLIIRTLGDLYIFILLLRVILQVVKADYYNPISQGVVRITQPVINPFRKMIPQIANTDISPVVFALLLKAAFIFLLSSHAIPLLWISILASAGVLYTFLDIIFYAVLGSVIISWVAPGSPHPAPQLIMQVTAPFYKLMQKVIPPIGGFDLSPIVIIISIQLIQSQLRPFI